MKCREGDTTGLDGEAGAYPCEECSFVCKKEPYVDVEFFHFFQFGHGFSVSRIFAILGRMREWIAQGNKPRNPDFKGEMTERQQNMVDTWEAQERLTPFLREACRNCMWVFSEVITPASYAVAEGNLSKEDAIKNVVEASRDCTGPEVNERVHDGDSICPRRETLKPHKGSCF